MGSGSSIPELRPGISEASVGCGKIVFKCRAERFSLDDTNTRLAKEIPSVEGQRASDHHHKGVPRSHFAEAEPQNEQTREVGIAGEQGDICKASGACCHFKCSARAGNGGAKFASHREE